MDYVLEHEDLMKIVSMYVPNSGFRRSLISYLLRLDYRNTYGQIEESLEDGELTDMTRGYPKHLVNPNTPYPVSNYGFVNTYSSNRYKDLGINMDTDSEELDNLLSTMLTISEEARFYETIPFNISTMMKEDLIKHIRVVFEGLSHKNDFVLVELCHMTQLFRDYRGNKIDVVTHRLNYWENTYRRKQSFIQGDVNILDPWYRVYT